MSEIADELERLAEVFQERARASHATEDTSVGYAYADVAGTLKERATEVRAQRIGPTYKAQPKPIGTWEGQWWIWKGAMDHGLSTPGRIERRTIALGQEQVHGHTTIGNWWCAFSSDLLTNDRWIYLGDGPEPAR